ncbi:MAG: ABC transporter permease [Flavobacteriaceae bacterium]|nr:ABC transporter permease [Flavobacteriaceae bacterium]
MIASIFIYELKRRLRHWTTLLFLAMLIFQGIWYTEGNFEYYVNEDLLMNSPAVFYKNLAGGGMLMMIIIAIVTGGGIYREIQYQTHHWIYTLPINEKNFFIGRFFSSYVYNVILALGYVLGMLLVPYSGIGEPSRFGPQPIGQLFHGFVVLLMPNIFLLTAIILAGVILSKRMALGYLGIFAAVMLFLVAQTVSEASGIKLIHVLADPFGYVGTEQVNNTMTGIEKNTAYLPLSSHLMTNRLIWFVVAVFLFLWSYRTFTYKRMFRGLKTKQSSTQASLNQGKPSLSLVKLPKPKVSYNLSEYVKKLFSLANLEFKNIVRPASFKIIIAIILLMITLQNLLWNAQYYIGPTLPLTSTMTFFRLSFGVFIMILLMVWAGELFFKERTVGFYKISDTLPVPVWVSQLSKYFAMCGVAFVMAFLFVFLGVATQILKGGIQLIDIGLFVSDLFGYNMGWLTYVIMITLVFFIAGLTANRMITHVLSVGIFFVIIIAFELELAEQSRFAFGFVPGIEDYSELTGYSIWKVSAPWYFLMWICLSIFMVFSSIYLWKRGVIRDWSKKLKLSDRQLNPIGKIIPVIALIGFFILQSFIITNVNNKGNFLLSSKEEKLSALYEKTYSYISDLPQPIYGGLDLEFEFKPQNRTVDYSANATLINLSSKPIDTLYLNTNRQTTMESEVVDSDYELNFSWKDKSHFLSTYVISPPLEPNDSLLVRFTGKKQYTGFSQSGNEPQADLIFKASFGQVKEYLPSIGYQSDKELDENRKRESFGLTPITSRKAGINNIKQRNTHLLAEDSNAFKGTIAITTNDGQIPIAPGRRIEEIKQDDKTTHIYELEQYESMNWYLGSGHYSKKIGQKENVATEILYFDNHSFNIEIYQNALHGGIGFVNKYLGHFPYSQVRLVEIPFYQDPIYVFPNAIAISEKEGWYADTASHEEESYLTFTVYSSLFKHWVLANSNIANVQGAEILTQAIPGGLALLAIANNNQAAADYLLEKKWQYYAKEKNDEPNNEPPLLFADGMAYLEQSKGVVTMYHIINHLGLEKFIDLWNHFINDNQFLVFADFFEGLKPHLTQDLIDQIERV